MAKQFHKSDIERIVLALNKRYGIAIRSAEFKNTAYSDSSLRDILIQRVSDELSGEWTTEKAMSLLLAGLKKIEINTDHLNSETELNSLIPLHGRRGRIRSWSEACGLQLDVLKPPGVLQGILIFLMFASIPFGIGMDWFFAGVCMLTCLLLILLLGKTASHFKMKTLGQMAEAIAWKNYLTHQKAGARQSRQQIEGAIDELLR